jgi:hypothetical protein
MVTAVSAFADRDVSYFSKRDLNANVQVSPAGTYLAMHVDQQGKDALAVLRTETLEPVNMIRFKQNRQPGEFHWVSDDRLIFRLEEVESWFDGGHFGEWLSQNADGRRSEQIFSYRGAEQQAGSHRIKRENIRAWGFFEDRLRSEPDKVLLTTIPFDRGGITEMLEVDVYFGTTRKVKFSPVRDPDYVTDLKARPRLVTGYADKGKLETWYWDLSPDDAQLHSQGSIPEGFMEGISFREDFLAYVSDNRETETRQVKLLDLESNTSSDVFSHERVDPSDYLHDEASRQLYAIEYEVDRPAYHFVQPDLKSARVLKSLSRAFGDKHVRIVSQTDDNRLSIAFVYSDTDPGAYYLFNSETGEAAFLVSTRPWVEYEATSLRETLTVEARDGLPLQVHLTRPAGEPERKRPLVVLIPARLERHRWRYDPMVQLLVESGYAVLQVDSRGMQGYGKTHEALGMYKWGTLVAADIVDSVRAVREQGLTGEAACAYGEIQGAFLALRIAMISPELINCAVAVGGIWDVEEMYRGVSLPWHYDRDDFVDDALAAIDPPSSFSLEGESLGVPALVFYGDANLDPSTRSTAKLRKMLDKKRDQKSVKMQRNKSGFYGEKARTEVYAALLKFLDQHL